MGEWYEMEVLKECRGMRHWQRRLQLTKIDDKARHGSAMHKEHTTWQTSAGIDHIMTNATGVCCWFSSDDP